MEEDRRERERDRCAARKEKDHACGSSVVRSSLHRFLKVPWSGVWLCVEWSERAGFSVSPLRTVRAQRLDRRPPGVAGAVAGLGLRERAVQSNLNRRARPTRGHRQSLLRLDVTRGSSCMPRATHAPIPRTILTARVPAIEHQQKHRCHRRIGVEVEERAIVSVAPPRESDDHARSVHRLPAIFSRKPASTFRSISFVSCSHDDSCAQCLSSLYCRRWCREHRETSTSLDGDGEEKVEESCGKTEQ